MAFIQDSVWSQDKQSKISLHDARPSPRSALGKKPALSGKHPAALFQPEKPAHSPRILPGPNKKEEGDFRAGTEVRGGFQIGQVFFPKHFWEKAAHHVRRSYSAYPAT